ncbi:unnamed protein product [Phyllotreta striolata]|uniref:Vacuolar protein sorting-associated protein 13A n=1 Tax=Phyllotreta striolata TaxID=444603 RepID=A0A9P0DWD5_PHYSR|nr:unnamed protein product [Phyllotreta striolata]
MLEGTVARLLNQLLGKYVVDLDTENLNVGIFSGQVQLTDLKLKPEALYELNLPIEVRAGTIGKIWLKIPWAALYNQPITINIEDIHVVAVPIVRNSKYDPERNKKLVRAAKKKILADLKDGDILGGPASFSERLISNVLSFFQLNITNVHIRYEDDRSLTGPIAAGLCVGSITAESTNSKWRPMKYDRNAETCYYILKLEAFSVYWNDKATLKTWDLPSEYYQWRNTMAASLQNYSINDQDFNFVVNPMSSKIKMVLEKSHNSDRVSKIHTEVVMQDCNVQLSKNQYDSVLATVDSMERMLISWQYLQHRPAQKIAENQKIWWRYASYASLEQRVKPYTWSRIRRVRQHYKEYLETYKQILLNPNDTELKLDLQKFEDNLSILNIVLARQQARLTVKERSISEKSFWSMLPSPERTLLCDKIGYSDNKEGEHTCNFRLGILSVTLTSDSREIFVLTMTQTVLNLKPNFGDGTYRASLKIEGLIVEGATNEDHLIPIVSSEHLSDSPAYFLKIDLEKLSAIGACKFKLNVVMDSVECIYNKPSIEELETFLTTEKNPAVSLFNNMLDKPGKITKLIKEKLLEGWEINANVKIPYIVIPEVSSYLKAEYLLVLDFGRYSLRTELCPNRHAADNATQMELEEQSYTKLNVKCTDFQILFCDNSDNWKDARRENCSEMHVVPKTCFTSICAISAVDLKSIPSYKFNIAFQSLKLNISERKTLLLLKYFNIDQIKINITRDNKGAKAFVKDKITGCISSKRLRIIQNKIRILSSYTKYRRYKVDDYRTEIIQRNKSISRHCYGDMNEAWARCVDLPGLEDNVSPNNNVNVLYGFFINEFSITFSRSSDSTDRQYLLLRLSVLTMDVALMTYGPAYQLSLNSILLTDKLHVAPNGQYLDLAFSPVGNNQNVLTVLFRKVGASCPDFWSHFHGVETSLVANLGTVNLVLHQEAVRTILQYSKYISNKIKSQTSPFLKNVLLKTVDKIRNVLHGKTETPVPPGSIKFSHSARLGDLVVTVCDSDFDIVKMELSGLEVDFLFRTNERFIFRSFLSNVTVEHLSDGTLHSKVLYTDEDKVFDVKYVRNSTNLNYNNDISPNTDETFIDGSFKFQLGRIHCTFLYKLIVQLQRFFANLEILPLIEKVVVKFNNALVDVTKTLKNNTRINFSINVSGPVILFPQKSSSPNVLVIDTGQLKVENFFKDYHQEVTENILVKLNDATASRGVMTLTAMLEMQETLIEPLSLNMDIKRFTNMKSSQTTWDIDSIIDGIQITLGQRDLIVIMSIYTDNIGEGKLLDIFPAQIKSPTDYLCTDETVRNLEAFFCEPKQKIVVAKCTVEEIKVTLFFDSGELLSSPVRDLNHGLCKLEINDIDVSVLIYNDKSLDGKLSVDAMRIEEIGPEAHALDKIILQSPADDAKNNNCQVVTVNKPPIVDINFHCNKTGDKSVDVIIGKLCLNLSVPFSEKLALFIIECHPKDAVDDGIVNPCYEAETFHTVSERPSPTSLTLSVRVNKPEIVFLVETASNKKRYFVTKSEILVDYSRHANRLNIIMSLSGLHSLFYDLNEYSEEPYVILRQCDVELCKSFSSEVGEKITLAVSSIYLNLCSEVVHSFNDVLNDVVEHFRVPDVPHVPNTVTTEIENLWEPKKLPDSAQSRSNFDDARTDEAVFVHEILLVPKFDVVVVFELERIKVFLVKSTVELTLYDWSSMLNCTCELTLQANYFNESVQSWEPFVEPVVVDEREYKPWEVVVKVFRDGAAPALDGAGRKIDADAAKKRGKNASVTTTEDEDSGEDMMYLEPSNHSYNGNDRRVKTSLSTFLDDSDSENEDGAMERLAAAISDLFTGDWNEYEESDCDRSSDEEDDLDELQKPKQRSDVACDKAYYVLLDAKETFNVTVTPTLIHVLNELVAQYSSKIISVTSDRKSIAVSNDVGPRSAVELYEKISGEENKLLCIKKFENDDSAPGSPCKYNSYVPEYSDGNYDDKDSFTDENREFDSAYDFESLASLQFPDETTPQLYERINKNFMKIIVPNFQTVQTNCSKKNWEKLIRLNSVDSNQVYHLAAKHVIGKFGRKIVVSSPLQIKNETCYALSLLYQPSILQQLNQEPLGDITNPFETTMRITVVEPQEEYNVPLHIAYHCKLFIQPAQEEGRYVSDSGIWWKDMATEMDSTHLVVCTPKPDTDAEIFCMLAMLKRNVEGGNIHHLNTPNYVVRLLPPLVISNFLPHCLEVSSASLKRAIKIEPGEKCDVYSLDSTEDQKLTIKLREDSSTWTGCLNFTRHLDEKIISLSADSKEVGNLAVNVKIDRETGCNLFFYAPYWIVNKTGLPLQIKASVSNTLYNCLSEDILLFTYKRHGKQTLNVKVYDSNWSNEFGLECVGTTGLIVCKDVERKKKYMFFLNSRLSTVCPRLTKIVTILPGFLITNNTDKALRFMEKNEKTDLWIDLQPFQTVIFWPETSSMEMYVKRRDGKAASHSFFISTHHRTVLRVDKGSAITVELTGGVNDSFKITFNEYKPGDAPVLIKNYCSDLFLKIQQRDLSPVTLLNPNHSLLYTWDDPTAPRQLVWNVYNNKGAGFSIDITKDGYGEQKIRLHSVEASYASSSSDDDDSDSSEASPRSLANKTRKHKLLIYWSCYREGLQRTILFTQHSTTHNSAIGQFVEKCHLEGLFALSGVGLSIFTSESDAKEHVYAAVSDTPAVWEVNVGRKWKTLTLELASWVEDKYRLHYKKCQLKDYIHIDFEKMYMLKPFFAELRRSYNPAVYFQFRRSAHHAYYDLRFQYVQIDNKQSNNVIFYPLYSRGLKENGPFLEVAVAKTRSLDVDFYRYVKFDVKNFFLHVEDDVVLKMADLARKSKRFKEEVLGVYVREVKSIHKSITARNNETIRCAKSPIEHLSSTSFGIQLNISNRTPMSFTADGRPFCKLLDYLFPYNMSPYMPMEGVHHKISPVLHVDLNTTLPNAMRNLFDQICTQFLQQYYSHVLGLQVLVNSFAIQPTIEIDGAERDKTADVLLYASRCLLGHVDMSPAAVEACVVDIFANQNIENIQRIRRHGSYHKSEIVPKTVTISSRNFVTGVPNALGQLIVTNQNAGLNCDGEMFFRTTGKALQSLITRHPDDKSDSVEVAKEALRRASILGEPIRMHLRLTRYKNKHLGLRPLSVHDSIGQYLMETIGNSRYANDTYWTHAALDKIGKSIIIVTLEHIIRVNKCRLWGPWEIEWAVELDDIIAIPKIHGTDLVLNLRQNESTTGKLQQIKIDGQKEMLVWLDEKIEQAIFLSMEEKSWVSIDN